MRLGMVIAAVLVLAGCAGGGHSTTTVTVAQHPLIAAGGGLGAQDARYFGQIVSITKVDAKRFLLVLKPESFLVGITANVASAAQQGTQCVPLSCPGVEDDHLVVPAGSRPLTFLLPTRTTGTVLTAGAGSFRATKVSAAQLAALVAGAKTPRLIDPLSSGLWLAVDVDTVTSFAQQFQP
jgi:hypothetical protein